MKGGDSYYIYNFYDSLPFRILSLLIMLIWDCHHYEGYIPAYMMHELDIAYSEGGMIKANSSR